MFKGLKSKIAEETKKLQNAVSQVAGDGIGGFALGRNSNDAAAHANGSDKIQQQGTTSSNPEEADTGMLVDIPLPNDDFASPSRQTSQSFVSANSSLSSFFDTDLSGNLAEGERTPTRQRHDSMSSVGSLDSNISFLMPATQGTFTNSNRLGVITSDLETDNESAAGSTFLSGASKEQISSVLNRLHGRAANYKDRYRQLAKVYNEVIKENDKIRTILTTTQDKALRRIQELREEKRLQEKAKRDLEENWQTKLLAKEKVVDTLQQQVRMLKDGKSIDDASIGDQNAEKERPNELVAHKERVKKLEELLSRCKDSMKSYKERIDVLATENDGLKQKLSGLEHEEGNAAISDFVNDRVAAQHKLKMQEVEREWNDKLTASQEETALAVAQAKHEMHVELEKKDQMIEALREKVKQSESVGSAEVEELKEKLDRAVNAEKILDDEKKDLVEQISRAKQAAVQIVREEESEKRQKLEDEWRSKLTEVEQSYETKLKLAEEENRSKMAEKTKEFNVKLREYEEQTQLAIEEREMQKSAVATKYDERVDQLKSEIEQLKTDKLELESSSERKITELTSKIASHTEMMGSNANAHASELDRVNAEKDKLLAELSETKNLVDSSHQKLETLKQELKAVEEEKSAVEKTYEERLATLERTLKESSETKSRTLITEYEERIQQLVADHEEQLKTVASEREKAVDQLRNEYEAEISKKEQEWRVQQNDSADEKANQLLGIIDQLRQEKSDLQVDRDRQLTEQRAKFDQLASVLEEERRSHNTEIKELNMDKERLMDDLQAKNDRLTSTLDELEQQTVKNQQLQDVWNSRVQEVKTRIEAYNVQIQELQTALAQERNGRQEIEEAKNRSMEEHEDQLRQLKEQFDSEAAKKENEHKLAIEELNVKLSADLEDSQKTQSVFQNSMDEQISDLKSKIAEITDLLELTKEQHQAEIDHLTSENASLAADLKKKDDQLNEALAIYEKEKARHENAMKEASDEWEQKINRLQDEILAVQRNTQEQLMEKTNELESEFEERSEQLQQDFQMELERKDEEWRTLMKSTSDQRADALVIEIEELKTRKSELETTLGQQVSSLNSKIAELTSSIDTDRQRHAGELDRLKTENDALSNNLDQMEKQLKLSSEELKKETSRHDEASKAVSMEWNVKLQETLDQLTAAEDNTKRIGRDYEAKMQNLAAENEEQLQRLRHEFQVEMTKKEEGLRVQHSATAEERVGKLVADVEKLQKEKSTLQNEYDQKVTELNARITAFSETMESDSNLHSIEMDRITAENASLLADAARKDDQLKSAIKDLEKQNTRHDQLMKLAQDEWAEKTKDYENRISVLERNAKDELDVQMKTAVAEHNEKVKQLCRDFQLEMSKKENEWQTEINGSYARSEEDRHRAVREYQKEAKQLHQELQEKSKRFNELKAAFEELEKEKEREIDVLKEQHQEDLHQLEDQLNARMRQRMDDMEQKHKQELDGLSTEWTTERRSVPAPAMQASSSWSSSPSEARSVSPAPVVGAQHPQLEIQAQIAQGDVRQESPMYLKQRVKQLEAQIEALKDKQRKELEMLVKGAMPASSDGSAATIDSTHANASGSKQRLASISLDTLGSNVLFAEPTEAEYLRNILFRYMTERESLGKESVTLAKAIAAVLKFSNDQTHIVVAKEESRSNSSW